MGETLPTDPPSVDPLKVYCIKQATFTVTDPPSCGGDFIEILNSCEFGATIINYFANGGNCSAAILAVLPYPAHVLLLEIGEEFATRADCINSGCEA